MRSRPEDLLFQSAALIPQSTEAVRGSQLTGEDKMILRS
jgi:hypothetical protein